MFNVRPMRVTFVIGAISMVSVIGGCSSQEDSASETPSSEQGTVSTNWTSADQVIVEVNAAGFDCEIDETDVLKQVITEYPATKEPIGGSIITCDGFQVMLIDSPDTYLADLRLACTDVTTAELESEALDASILAGNNYLITGRETNSAFPTESLAQELQSTFGGRLLSLREYYSDLCEGIPAATAEPDA